MLDEVAEARVVITNYHALKLREELRAPKLAEQILQVATSRRAPSRLKAR